LDVDHPPTPPTHPPHPLPGHPPIPVGKCYCRYDTSYGNWALAENTCKDALYQLCQGNGRLPCSWLDAYYGSSMAERAVHALPNEQVGVRARVCVWGGGGGQGRAGGAGQAREGGGEASRRWCCSLCAALHTPAGLGMARHAAGMRQQRGALASLTCTRLALQDIAAFLFSDCVAAPPCNCVGMLFDGSDDGEQLAGSRGAARGQLGDSWERSPFGQF